MSNEKNSPTINTSVKPTQNSKIQLFFIFILIVGLLYGLYFTLTIQQEMKILRIGVNAFKTQYQQDNAQFQSAIDEVSTHQKQLTSTIEQLNKQIEQFHQEHGYNTQDWTLLTAKHYIELAIANQHWESNSQTTIYLLQNAQTLLMALNDPNLSLVLNTLNDNIEALKANTNLELTVALSQLDDLSSKLDSLPLHTYSIPSKLDLSSEETTSNGSTWHDVFLNNLARLKKLVIIQHHDESIKPLIGIEEEAILRGNLHLLIQRAQWALLHNQLLTYRQTLQTIIDTIKNHFNADNQSVDIVLKRLIELQSFGTESNPTVSMKLPILLNELLEKSATHLQGPKE